MNKKVHWLLKGVILISLLEASWAFAQTVVDPRQVQTSSICTKIIYNNTRLPMVEPTTHRLMPPNGGSANVNLNCKISQQRQLLPGSSALTIMTSGRTAKYYYQPNGSVKVYISGPFTRASSIQCTGCSGSVRMTLTPALITTIVLPGVTIPTPITTSIVIPTSAQFSDCDNQGTCVCVPCPIRSFGATVTTTGGSSIITTPANNTVVVTPAIP